MISSLFNGMRNVRSYLLGTLFAGAMGVTATGCGFKRTDKCIDDIICSAESHDADQKRDAADANYSGNDAHQPNNYDAARPQHDSGQPQYDAQPRPECRVDIECPGLLKCIEGKCVTDEYDAGRRAYDAGAPAEADSGFPDRPVVGDSDRDGVADERDNCMMMPNADQQDTDGDTLGDVCDVDDDNDGRTDAQDNCVLVPNPAQEDNDRDAQGDVCDVDDDNDGFRDGNDKCPRVANLQQEDRDRDGMGDHCDDHVCLEGLLYASTFNAQGRSYGIRLFNLRNETSEEIINVEGTETEPSWLPDGTGFVYVGAPQAQGGQLGLPTVRLFRFSGMQDVLVAQGRAQIQHPSVSPNGQWLNYASNETGRWDVYRTQINGEGKQCLTCGLGNQFYQAVWIDDNNLITYTRSAEWNNIFLLQGVNQVRNIFRDGSPRDFRPYSMALGPEYLAFVDAGQQVYICAFDRRNLSCSQDVPWITSDDIYFKDYLSWSPHGDQLALDMTQRNNPDSRAVYVIDNPFPPDNRRIRRLIEENAISMSSAWSPGCN